MPQQPEPDPSEPRSEHAKAVMADDPVIDRFRPGELEQAISDGVVTVRPPGAPLPAWMLDDDDEDAASDAG